MYLWDIPPVSLYLAISNHVAAAAALSLTLSARANPLLVETRLSTRLFTRLSTRLYSTTHLSIQSLLNSGFTRGGWARRPSKLLLSSHKAVRALQTAGREMFNLFLF